MELSQELSSTRAQLTLFLFSDCLEITKLRVNLWKAPGMKSSKSYKHVVLIQLNAIRTLFDVNSSSLTVDGRPALSHARCMHDLSPTDAEQFGMLCSIDGQIRQLLFRAIHGHNSSRTLFTDSMSSLSSMSTMSSCTRPTNHKTDILYQLAKAISDDRCLLDQVSLRCAHWREPRRFSSF